jgi:hypothetical protein
MAINNEGQNDVLEKVEKIIQPEIQQPDMNFDNNIEDDGLLVKVMYSPSKNHIHVEANVQDGDELVLMMLRKAYDAWKKRVYDKIINGNTTEGESK